MQKINKIISFPISKWEVAISSHQEIEIDEFQLHHGLVCGANGTITVNGKRHHARWLYDGRCYYKGKRVVKYDIAL